MARSLTIGQLAEAAGMPARTIRYYEAIGILPVPRRTASGYRLYGEAAIERLRFVSRARSLGLPLRQLRALTGALTGGPTPPVRPRLLAIVREQLAFVHRRISDLESLRQRLDEIAHQMEAWPRARENGACRCLEIERPLPRRRPP